VCAPETRASGPFGEHFVFVGGNAPDDATEEHEYQIMTRVRAFDHWVRTGEVTLDFTNELDSIECARWQNHERALDPNARCPECGELDCNGESHERERDDAGDDYLK
jgi:hypothetical protein